MREIKFRAWSRGRKEMGEVRILDLVCEIVQVKIENVYGMWNFEYIELLEFTGLQDKNNKDIYEGDILKYKYMFQDKMSTSEVVWNDERNGFYLYSEREEEFFVLETELKKQFEVIGNIYENSELLEVGEY